MNKKPDLVRCPWVPLGDQIYLRYHDKEWGVPVYNDRKIFEFLVLESSQAGLSWRIILGKRKGYHRNFAGFNPVRVAKFTAKDVRRLLNDSGIIRNRLKIRATISNAQCFLRVKKEFGSFSKYIWGFVGNKPIRHSIKKLKDYPVVIPEAVALAKDLKSRGFKFLGPTVCYAHMQAIGMVNDHSLDCFRRKVV